MPTSYRVGRRRRVDPPQLTFRNPTSMDPLDTHDNRIILDTDTATGTEPLFGGVDESTAPGGVGTDIGTIAFEVNDMTVAGSLEAGPALVSVDETVRLHVHWVEDATDWAVTATVNGVNTTFSIAGAPTDTVQFAVDTAGNVAILVGDTITGPNDQAILGGLFAGKQIVAGVMVDPNGSTVPAGTTVDVAIRLEPVAALDTIDGTSGLISGTVGRLF